MALKPTIYKMRIALSDVDNNYYDSLNITLARHPSENMERMVARLLAFCFHSYQQPSFTSGLSTPNEPDLWVKSLDDQLLHWLDVGEPAPERIKKATRNAAQVSVYSFNSKSDVWWQQNAKKFSLTSAKLYQLPWPAIQQLAGYIERTMEISVMLSGDSAYIATAAGEVDINRSTLQ